MRWGGRATRTGDGLALSGAGPGGKIRRAQSVADRAHRAGQAMRTVSRDRPVAIFAPVPAGPPAARRTAMFAVTRWLSRANEVRMSDEAPKTPVLTLIDASGFIFRAYHAIQHLSTSKGVATNAVYG